MKNKKVTIALLALAIIMVSLVSATLAYDAIEGRARNVITTGGVDITIIETSESASGKIAGVEKLDGTGIEFTDIFPGATASKIVQVKNVHEKCWLRAKVEVEMHFADGSKDTSAVLPLSINYNNTEWTKGDDGYFYYNEALAKDETTEALFTEVLFAPGMGNEYAQSNAKITVFAEAVQFKNNEDLDPLSWPTGGEV